MTTGGDPTWHKEGRYSWVKIVSKFSSSDPSLWILDSPAPSFGFLPVASASLVSHLELTSPCSTHSHASCLPLTSSSQGHPSQTRFRPHPPTHSTSHIKQIIQSPALRFSEISTRAYLLGTPPPPPACAGAAVWVLAISSFVLSQRSPIRSLHLLFRPAVLQLSTGKELSFQNMLFSFPVPSEGSPLPMHRGSQTCVCSRITQGTLDSS